ncbi:ATPdependent RNA helicase [Bulinus truncatus]|nr:ATPdependent RNA helicase [Bulinus truncatus]
MSTDKVKPRFWKPGTAGPGLTKISEEKNIPSEHGDIVVPNIVYNPYKNLSIEQQRQKLPAFQYRNHILYLTEKYQTLIIIGETGCGKSTQIPQYLLEAGWATEGYVIGVTQPRRVAAVTVATRVAEERGSILGDEIGYLIRFDECCDSDKTRVKFMTDGMMIREIMKDPLLQKYSVILLDEAHERAINTDVILGLLRKIQKRRKDLRLIVASATLNAEEMKDFFNRNKTDDLEKDTVAILTIEGREYPVDIHYSLDPVPNYIKAAVECVMKIHFNDKPGDIVVFLTGMSEVEDVVSQLISEARKLKKEDRKMKVLPMHGSLPASEQMKIFERTSQNVRKIVVATNIAEASVTIPGITYVIDTGFVKPRHNPQSEIIKKFSDCTRFPRHQPISEQEERGKSSAGKAYRLYTEESYEKLLPSTVPEMQRSDLAPVILTSEGTWSDFGCSEEAIIVAAMSQIQNIFVTPSDRRMAAERERRKFSVMEGDHLSLINVYKSFIKYGQNSRWCHEHCLNFKGLNRAIEITNQLGRLLTKFNVKIVSCKGE